MIDKVQTCFDEAIAKLAPSASQNILKLSPSFYQGVAGLSAVINDFLNASNNVKKVFFFSISKGHKNTRMADSVKRFDKYLIRVG